MDKKWEAGIAYFFTGDFDHTLGIGLEPTIVLSHVHNELGLAGNSP